MTIKIGTILGLVGVSLTILASLMWLTVSFGVDMGSIGYGLINFIDLSGNILILLFFVSLLIYITNKESSNTTDREITE